jgi:chromosome segregation ATPase
MEFLMRKSILVAAVLLGASACTDDDPSRGGFFGGVSGLSSGKYDRQTQERRDTLSAEQQRNRQLHADAARASDDRRRVASERASLQRQNAALNSEIARLRGKLASTESRRGQNAGELRRLSGDLDSLQASGNQVNNDPTLADAEKRRRLDELNQRKQLLERAIDQAAGARS